MPMRRTTAHAVDDRKRHRGDTRKLGTGQRVRVMPLDELGYIIGLDDDGGYILVVDLDSGGAVHVPAADCQSIGRSRRS